MSSAWFLTSACHNSAMFKLFFCCVLLAGAYGFNHGQDLVDFNDYVLEFKKTYTTPAERNNAMYYFNYHKNLIRQQNALADRNSSSFRVKANQFSDIRLITFAARLPKAIYPSVSNGVTPVPPNEEVPAEFDMLSDLGLTVEAQDQGTVCSSSWAYAVVKSIQIMNALQTGEMTPLSLSAQALIDCAGMGTGCSTQVPQMGFDYLRQDGAILMTEEEYKPNPSSNHQGMCAPMTMSASPVALESYAIITDANDTLLKRYVASQIPVIVEYNPASFGFMHYSSGVFVPPVRAQASSSQFLVVVGYGHDTETNLDYWLCINSFGAKWGDRGFIKILRTSTQPLAKFAIFPNSLAPITTVTPSP